jgi:hypothetical protein
LQLFGNVVINGGRDFGFWWQQLLGSDTGKCQATDYNQGESLQQMHEVNTHGESLQVGWEGGIEARPISDCNGFVTVKSSTIFGILARRE